MTGNIRGGWLSLVFLCIVMSGMLTSRDLQAQTEAITAPPIDGSAIRVPSDFDQVTFYLITVDVGDNVWDNFGHTALRMVDETTNTDLVFNWGLFDASIGYVRFAANFARGIMDYQLGVTPPGWELGRYQQEARTVWQDELVLTNAQKRRLYERLAWNIREENLVYEYDYFFDNCTTRVRDYLDEALGGSLSEQSRALTQSTFRDEVRSHYASLPVISLSLDVLMNERIDRRMTQWEQMFLPLELRAQLNRAGLLTDQQVLMEFPSPEPGVNPYYLAALLIIPGLLLLLCLRPASIASFSSQPGLSLRMPALTYRLLGLMGLIIALFSGIYGLIMSLGWLFSSHQDIHGNLNLLLFWPTDLFGVAVALRWLLTGRAWNVSSSRHQWVMTYFIIHVMAALVYLVIALFGLSGQRVGSLLLYVLPVLAVFTALTLSAGMNRVRSISFG
ncbi:DUF4105 domain-containing protein [Pseudohongiella sp.]|uniref:Lnb N-terminal periplasmic domain-containing protein n=1 Tax=marine sediment metagenome TaxID=412755 RepID=A0A0F9WIZ1_9ZZZZ|nr:DUF4105 domain-containing protein [Pseudohongiella sp.]HDZ07644.1 DUF4105 domain-containing protein [Pseudohongiella sp.]HEA63224.1 DUF4105 domain-containing protein [Pseudohongiella sp.]